MRSDEVGESYFLPFFVAFFFVAFFFFAAMFPSVLGERVWFRQQAEYRAQIDRATRRRRFRAFFSTADPRTDWGRSGRTHGQ